MCTVFSYVEIILYKHINILYIIYNYTYYASILNTYIYIKSDFIFMSNVTDDCLSSLLFCRLDTIGCQNTFVKSIHIDTHHSESKILKLFYTITYNKYLYIIHFTHVKMSGNDT